MRSTFLTAGIALTLVGVFVWLAVGEPTTTAGFGALTIVLGLCMPKPKPKRSPSRRSASRTRSRASGRR